VPTQQADPQLPLTNLAGVTRSLDQWLTMGHLAMVVLPSWPEAQAYVQLGRRAFRVFNQADCTCCWLVTGNEAAARRVLGRYLDEYVVYLDPDGSAARAMGVERTPAFLHLRADASVAKVADGWDADAWQSVADSLATAMRWTKPVYPEPDDPPTFYGWNT
jgi:hypothetical protein